MSFPRLLLHRCFFAELRRSSACSEKSDGCPATSGLRNSRFISLLLSASCLMTISFFLTLGLLQRFDLSYLYPFQGLSVIMITLMAAVVLKEKLTLQLMIGSLLISAGIVLVSMS